MIVDRRDMRDRVVSLLSLLTRNGQQNNPRDAEQKASLTEENLIQPTPVV